MISELLDRDFVLAETRAQRDWLVAVREKVLARDKAALAELKKHGITPAQIDRAIAALDDALARAKNEKKDTQAAYIPSDPVTNGLQKGLTKIAIEKGEVQSNAPTAAPAGVRGVRRAVATRGPSTRAVDTSPELRLKRREAGPAKTQARRGTRTAFVEGNPFAGGDPLYALDGFKAKFGALFTKRRAFNPKPARVASSRKPLSLYLFGDWGTGLDLAAQVTKRISEQIAAADKTRQPHVIHLGDVYYVGDADEYKQRMLPYWPVPGSKRDVIGSWSLNGNHDMYSGGAGYFDGLLRQDVFLRWHGDESGSPSSFFLIEDPDWQVFGLDTSWNLPSIGSTIFGKPTKEDYGGQNGILTTEQAAWMAKQRNSAKGCILLTHHQPGSSRANEAQHADDAVALLKSTGVYSQIDAWIWGHEHRGVVFKPKSERKSKRLKDAPNFCACLGHGGVPVTEKNLDKANRIADVLWEEDRLDATSPVYEGMRVVPFGFARIDTKPGAFEFRVFDHTGQERYSAVVNREARSAPSRGGTRSATRGTVVKVTRGGTAAPARTVTRGGSPRPTKPTNSKAPKKTR